MYLARFCYDVLPANRQRAIDFIRQEVKSARDKGLKARLLIPLTRGERSAALQFEVELTGLDQLDQFRQSGGREKTCRDPAGECRAQTGKDRQPGPERI